MRSGRSLVQWLRVAVAWLLFAATGFVAAAEYRVTGEPATILYDAPSAKAKPLFVYGRDVPMEVLVNVEGWTKVRDVNGTIGWVSGKGFSDKRVLQVRMQLADVRAPPDTAAPLVLRAVSLLGDPAAASLRRARATLVAIVVLALFAASCRPDIALAALPVLVALALAACRPQAVVRTALRAWPLALARAAAVRLAPGTGRHRSLFASDGRSGFGSVASAERGVALQRRPRFHGDCRHGAPRVASDRVARIHVGHDSSTSGCRRAGRRARGAPTGHPSRSHRRSATVAVPPRISGISFTRATCWP